MSWKYDWGRGRTILVGAQGLFLVLAQERSLQVSRRPAVGLGIDRIIACKANALILEGN